MLKLPNVLDGSFEVAEFYLPIANITGAMETAAESLAFADFKVVSFWYIIPIKPPRTIAMTLKLRC